VTISFFTDEHVPSVFVTTLRSSGYAVVRANDEFGEETNDKELLEHCAKEGYLYITNDKKDFTRTFSEQIDHAGIIIYTDPLFLRDSPAEAVNLIDRVLEFYPPHELQNERIWLDQWREK